VTWEEICSLSLPGVKANERRFFVYTAYFSVQELSKPTLHDLLRGSRGRLAFLTLKHWLFLDVKWKPQICPLFQNLEMQKITYWCYLGKNHRWSRNGWSWNKTGMLCPRPGPKTATAQHITLQCDIQM